LAVLLWVALVKRAGTGAVVPRVGSPHQTGLVMEKQSGEK
jgi:hypothetical protein